MSNKYDYIKEILEEYKSSNLEDIDTFIKMKYEVDIIMYNLKIKNHLDNIPLDYKQQEKELWSNLLRKEKIKKLFGS